MFCFLLIITQAKSHAMHDSFRMRARAEMGNSTTPKAWVTADARGAKPWVLRWFLGAPKQALSDRPDAIPGQQATRSNTVASRVGNGNSGKPSCKASTCINVPGVLAWPPPSGKQSRERRVSSFNDGICSAPAPDPLHFETATLSVSWLYSSVRTISSSIDLFRTPRHCSAGQAAARFNRPSL